MERLTEQQILSEYAGRANACGLRVDCPAQGDPKSKIIIIGEAPGEREASMKIPLVGSSGQLLWKVLREHGIERTDCWVTNVSKRQVSLSSKNDARDPLKPNELQHWAGLLEWELSHLQDATIIIALGGIALKALFGLDGITSWRGSVLKWAHNDAFGVRRELDVLLSYNPAMVLREPKWEPIFKFDMHKATRVIRGTYKEMKVDGIINPSPREAIDYISKLRDEAEPTSYDIETIAGETACHGLYNGSGRPMCINLRDAKRNLYSTAEERAVLLELARLFADTRIKWITQNGNFDCYWIWYKDRIQPPRIWLDTLLAHHTLYPNLSHNLGFLTAQYTDHPYYKDEISEWREGGHIDTFWLYNCKDTAVTRAAAMKLLAELQAQGLFNFFFNHVMALLPELTYMTTMGIKIDTSLKGALVTSLREEVNGYKEKVIRLAQKAINDPNYTFNPRSKDQLADLLFNRLRLIGRGFSTDAENRERCARHPNTSEEARQLLSALDTYKAQDKFLGTYAEMEIDNDLRARCEYKQFGTKSAPGRLSSSKVMWGTGMNLQNQPQKAQQMFIADEGYEFTYFDLSQAEARVVAYEWNVKALIENFERAAKDNTFDVHRGNASRIFKVPYEDIPSYDRLELGKHTDDPLRDGEPTMRYLGKRCVHGLNYRMQPQKLADVCEISLSQAQEAYNSYHRAFPEIKEAWKRIEDEMRTKKQLWTPMGRRLLMLEPIYTDEQLESIVAFVPQSTIGDKVGSVITKCHNDPGWPRENGHIAARMMLNIHDALICMNRPAHRSTVMRIMSRHASWPLSIRGHQVIIPCDFKVSVPDEKGLHRWSNMKKYKAA